MSFPNQDFRTTRWSMVRKASAADCDTTSVAALADFCNNYRGPLLAFTRVSVARHQDAEDLLHGFFEKLLERNFLAMADPDRGRLRTFLLTCLKRHIADEYRRETAAKRGGGHAHAPLDEALSLAADSPGPDEVYHREWAMVILARSVTQLRESWLRSDKGALFDDLRPWLGYAPDGDEDRAKVAAKHGMSAGALKTALYRLRKEYREILLREVADTLEVKTPEEVMAELKELLVRV